MTIRRILLVDDSKIETRFLAKLLEHEGFVVDTVHSEDELYEALELRCPDLIVMDIVMPGKNGFHLTRHLKRHPSYAHIPVVLCSSKSESTDKLWGMRQGASGYLTKPLCVDSLLKLIGELSTT